MLPIKVFYHIYIPADPRAAMWTWYVDQQLTLIKTSKLSNIAQVNVTVTMPMLWASMFEIGFTANNNKEKILTFGEKVTEYINTRYPFANILEIRDTPANLYEGLTLRYLYDNSQFDDFLALYVHSKGVVSASASVANWREILNHYHITEWPTAIKLLEDYQVLGVADAHTRGEIVSGNFFWARSDYIKTLQEPLNTTTYVTDENMYPSGYAYRYGFEKWILSNNPKLYYLIDTKTDHFDNYCFLEDLLKKS